MFGLPPPHALYAGAPGTGAIGSLSSNTAYFVAVYLIAPATLTGFRVVFGVGGNGNFDIGIYDGNGNLLVNNGAIASSGGTKTVTLATAKPLSAGKYWLGFWLANNTDTVYTRGINANTDLVQSLGVSNSLPASMSGSANVATMPSLIGLLQGGWS